MLSAKVRVGTVDSIDNPFEHEVTASIPGSETRSGSGRRERRAVVLGQDSRGRNRRKQDKRYIKKGAAANRASVQIKTSDDEI